MKKKHFSLIPEFYRYWESKIGLKMKATLIVLLICIGQTFAVDLYSQNKRLSLNMSDVPLKSVLEAIEDHSEFFFMYEAHNVNVEKKVTVSVDNKTIPEILNDIFANTDITYKINNRQIALSTESLSSVNQQSKSVSGKVTDSAGIALPGVSVVLKGTTIGTITDADGQFRISLPADAKTLLFSFVGMKSQELTIGNKTTINVVMEEESIGLEEVVAIGYGTVKKSDLTGAVGSVSGAIISERQSTQISQALQGAISGVTVTRNNNAPGSTASIIIRGITTIGDNSPLVIVDGVPVNNINDISPNDVENLTVLKDAASASIYGSRAAAGVILITTKRAKTGQLQLDYNVEYGFEKPTISPKYADAVRYMKMVNELRWNDNGNGTDEYPIYPKNIVENYYTLNKENPDLYPNTNWESLVFNDYAPKQSHILSLTAGTKNIRTKATLAYDKINALYDNRTFERITARFNNDVTINKFLSATFDFYAKRSISKQPVVDPIERTRMTPPVYAALWSDGRVAFGKAGGNIYGQMKYGGFNDTWDNQVGGKISIDLTPFEGFKISGILSPNLNFVKGKIFMKQIPAYTWDDPTVFEGYLVKASSTSLNEVRNDNYQITTQFLANFNKALGFHNINAMAGYENYYAIYENLGASRDQYILTSFPYLNLGPLEYRNNSGSSYENAYRSWFGRVMYNYKNRYLLQANIRYDASSRFQENYRWGSFPSFSAGWILTEEPFMKHFSKLSFLKLRSSWGVLGNDRIGNYPYQSTMAFSNALFYQGNAITSSQTAAQIRYAIKNITWETTESIDLGVDANFLNNRLRFTGDYYKKTTKDMLLALQIPIYLGFENPDQNTGKMNTKGWEADLGWNDQIGDLKYSVSVNISDFKSVMGNLGGTEFIGDQIKIEGSEFNEWYGYKSDGLFQTQAEVDNSPKLNASVKPGDVKYKDISGPDGKPDGKVPPEYDRILLGGSLPRYVYGGNIKLYYKDFDFSLVLQGVGKQYVRMETGMIRPFLEQWLNMPLQIDGRYWSKYNTESQNAKAEFPRFSDVSSGNNYAMSDYWLFNGAYFRLKNITLGYNIPVSLTQKLGIQSCRVYSSISDFLSINNYPKGWDPENSLTAYPITASFVMGISVKF